MTGPDSVLIGGRRIPDYPGQTVPEPAATSSLNIVSAPYGPFNAGCGLCLFTSQSQISDDRAGISGFDYRIGAAALRGGEDLVGLYEAPTALEARMVLLVDHYDAHSVTLRTPLTPAQVSELRRNMYIVTNSLDPRFGLRPMPGYTGSDAAQLVNLVAGLVSGWSADGRTIEVAGWAVPSGSDFRAGQVPDARHLDRFWSQYDSPVVFVGAGTKMFGRNTYMYYDGSRTRGHATSLVRAMETEEVDLRYTASHAHEVEMRGLTISMDPRGGFGPHGLTSDSYHLLLSGYSPNMLVFNDGRDTNLIKGHSFLVHGNEGVDKTRAAAELFEHSAYADGSNNVRLVGYMTRNGTQTGAKAASMHLGLRIDGQQGAPLSGGTWGEVLWNAGGGNNGGLALCGGSGRCGVGVSWDGTVRLGDPNAAVSLPGSVLQFASASNRLLASVRADEHGDLSLGTTMPGGGGIRPAAYRLAALPGTGVAGTQLYCIDCHPPLGHGSPGIPVWWNGHGWTDALGNQATR